MTSPFFVDFLVGFDAQLKRQRKKAILLIDNCPLHHLCFPWLTNLNVNNTVWFINTSPLIQQDCAIFYVSLHITITKWIFWLCCSYNNVIYHIQLLIYILYIKKCWLFCPLKTFSVSPILGGVHIFFKDCLESYLTKEIQMVEKCRIRFNNNRI